MKNKWKIGKDGKNSLHCCVMNSKMNKETIKYIIENKTEINSKDNSGNTALHLFLRNREKKTKKHEIQFLLDLKSDLNIKNKFSSTPLLTYMNNKEKIELEIVKFLVEKKSDLNITNKIKNSALILSCQNQDENKNEIIQYLIENKSDLNVENQLGLTSLHYKMIDTDVTLPLLQKLLGDEIDLERERNGFSPFEHICKH